MYRLNILDIHKAIWNKTSAKIFAVDRVALLKMLTYMKNKKKNKKHLKGNYNSLYIYSKLGEIINF